MFVDTHINSGGMFLTLLVVCSLTIVFKNVARSVTAVNYRLAFIALK